MKTITALTLLIALAGLIYTFFDDKPQPELTRLDCVDITLFAPLNGKNPRDICEKYGGVAPRKDASQEAVVVLVRNQRFGGFEGRNYTVR